MMKPIRVVMGVATILLILIFVHGVQAAETYGYVTQWGSPGAGNGRGKMPRNNFFNRR